MLTERHPDSKANPRRRRQSDHQEDVDEYGGEWNPRYERRAEVKFRRIPGLTDEQDAQTEDTDQTADGYRDGPPVASTQPAPTVNHEDAQS